MHTIAILSQKGGTGKTTVAVHLAEALAQRGGEVVVIDLDPQASATQWRERKDRENPEVFATPASRLNAALDGARKGGAAFAIIDTAPHSEQGALTAAKAAELVLVPCRFGGFDLSALSTTAELLSLAGKTGYVVLNAFPPRGANLVIDAQAAVKAKGLEVAPVVLRQRAAFRDASITGDTARESDPTGAAALEMAALEKWAFKMCAGTQTHKRTSKQGRA